MEKILSTLKKDKHKSTVKKIFDSNQEHVLKFWHELDEIKRDLHLEKLDNIDFSLLSDLIQKHISSPDMDKKKREISPLPYISLPANEEEIALRKEVRDLGEKAIKNGEVAVFVVAGGQGSRLGFDSPKGKFPITQIKNKTLFQLHAEKILALSKKYSTTIPWFIMTSEINHEETKKYFEDNNYFNLEKENIFIFKQGMMPAIDKNGKLILKDKHEVFTNPNGHGGSIMALYMSGAVKEMKKRGVKYLFYYQIDNPLVVIADPIFVGYHILNNAEMSAKAVAKSSPEEKVGVFGYIDNKPGVIEYSDLTDEEMRDTNSNGTLKYSAGSIAIHLFNVDFIEKENNEGLKLPFHVAKKKIKSIDGEIDGIKFETFVFDALADAKEIMILEVNRDTEFAPVKNKEGADSPDSARNMMNDMYADWLEEAGVEVPRDCDGIVDGKIEISPLFAVDLKEFLEKYKETPRLSPGFELYIE